MFHLKSYPTEKNSGIPRESTGILVEFYWNSSGIKCTFFHWKRVIPLEFPLESSGNSTGSVEIPLDSVEIPLDSSAIPLDSSGIPLDSSGIPLDFHLIPVEIPLDSSDKAI